MRNCTVNITAKVKGDLVTLDEDVCKEKEMLEVRDVRVATVLSH